jgi:peptidoglycan/LPS O-acetylase OafA/YrhL
MSKSPLSETKLARSQSAGEFRLGYRPALDGLRGVAILAVVAVHTGRINSRAAFIGVDLFFVLSGFLITCLLLEEWDLFGSFSLKRFYVRRFLRLFPALVVMLSVFVIYHWVLSPMPRIVAARVSIDALVALFYSSNWALAAGFHQPNLFGHAWSLSIEEQFYLLWPVILLFLLRRTSSRASLANCIVLGVFLAALNRWLMVVTGSDRARIFYGTDTRADCLLLGCALAALLASPILTSLFRRSCSVRLALKFAGFGAVGGLIFLNYYDFDYTVELSVAYFLIPLCGVFILLEVLVNDLGVLSRALKTHWLAYIGKVSYGIYIWHYPIFTEVQHQGWPAAKELTVEFLLTALAVLASYYLLERPVLRLKRKFDPRPPKADLSDTKLELK